MSIIPGVEKAKKAGIHCFTVDQLVYSDDILCHVGIDQESVGALDAEYLINRFKGKQCNVLEIHGRLGPFSLNFGTRDFEIPS
jgi:ABC-type sugar transport system substrate-binding protein